MEKDRLRTRWLPLAILIAILLIEPFVAVSVGVMLALMFYNYDSRPAVRKVSLVLAFVLAVVFAQKFFLEIVFSLTAAAAAVWLLRRHFFSSITTVALVACLLSTALIAVLVLGAGTELWLGIENEARRFMQETVSSNRDLDSETLENIKTSTRMMIWLLPGQFFLMMMASIFVAVLIFRRYGEYDLSLYLGCSQFRYYRFEDNWIWLVILALVLLLASHQSWIGRVGANALYVMGVLYLLRGIAVIFHFIALQGGGLFLKLLVVAVCFPPLCLIHLFFGLIDTWLDFRKNTHAVGK